MSFSISAHRFNVTEYHGGFLYNVYFQDVFNCCVGVFDVASTGGKSTVYKRYAKQV